MKLLASGMVKRGKTAKAGSSREVKVLYLDDTEEIITTQVDSQLRDVFTKGCQAKDILDTDILGLATVKDGVPIFLDLDTKISKVAGKGWKSTITETSNGADRVHLTVTLMVQHYVDKPKTLSDSKLRWYYSHQLRRNYISYPFMYPDDRCFLLACYLTLSHNVSGTDEIKVALDPRKLFPAWVVEKHGLKYIKHHLPRLVNDFLTLSHLEAESLALSAMTNESATPYSIHLYFMKKDIHSKSDTQKRHHSSKHTSTKHGSCLQCSHVYLGIGSYGIIVYEIGDNGFIDSSSEFNWKDIVNVSVNKKRLQIYGMESSLALIAEHESISDGILRLVRCTHQKYLKEGRHLPNKALKEGLGVGQKNSTTSPNQLTVSPTIYEDKQEGLNTHIQPSLTAPTTKPSAQVNRYSLISTTSSTTSGIVSDKTCFSYYGSNDDLLNRNKTITSSSSQDSLLEPSGTTKSRPVQRATSEPSKKYEHYKDRQTRRNLYAYQPMIARAASDNTVRILNRLDNPIYENIESVRNRLIAAAKLTPSKLSPRVSQDAEFLLNATSLAYSKHRLMVLSQSALNRSLGQLNQQSSLGQGKHNFSSQQNLMKTSPSIEDLLKNYSPPPSYSERHEKQRQMMLVKLKEHNETTPVSHKTTHHSNPEIDNNLNSLECKCRAASSSELDRIKDNKDLPLISSLCNDKYLNLNHADYCNQCNNITNRHTLSHSLQANRPMSWHSESFVLPQLLPVMSQPLEGY